MVLAASRFQSQGTVTKPVLMIQQSKSHVLSMKINSMLSWVQMKLGVKNKAKNIQVEVLG